MSGVTYELQYKGGTFIYVKSLRELTTDTLVAEFYPNVLKAVVNSPEPLENGYYDVCKVFKDGLLRYGADDDLMRQVDEELVRRSYA